MTSPPDKGDLGGLGTTNVEFCTVSFAGMMNIRFLHSLDALLQHLREAIAYGQKPLCEKFWLSETLYTTLL